MMTVLFAPLGARTEFVDHGVAAPVSRARALYATQDQEGRPLIVIWLRDIVNNGVLLVDPVSGENQQVSLPERLPDAPYATILTEERYLYAVTGGWFWEFDIHAREWTIQERVGDQEAMSFTLGPDGIVYAATYPKAHIVSFDPSTKRVLDYGPVNKEAWPQYPRGLAMGADGWIYCSIGNTQSQTIAFHPESGEIRKMVTEGERNRGRGRVFLGEDKSVYGVLVARGPWYRLEGGDAHPIEESPTASPVAFRSGTQEDVFPEFPAGGRVTDFSIADRWLEVAGLETTPKRVELNYASAGSRVYSLFLSDTGKIYASTGHPLRFVEFDPTAGTATNWGFGGKNGHMNAFAQVGSSLFGGLYSFGDLVRYDLSRPWSDAPGDNPKILTRAEAVVNRPSAVVAHPDGRHVIMTGGPGYGATGGGMLIYDLEADEATLLDHEQVIRNQSTHALLPLADGNLVGATTTLPGTGGVAKAKEASLYLFDWENRIVVYQTVPVAGSRTILDLAVGGNGLIYGLAEGPAFFVFDPIRREVVVVEEVPQYGSTTGGQAPKVLCEGPFGEIYALFQNKIVKIHSAENQPLRHSLLAEAPVSITVGAVIHDDRLYFASGSSLWSYKIR